MEGRSQCDWRGGVSAIGGEELVLLEGRSQCYWRGGVGIIGGEESVLLEGRSQCDNIPNGVSPREFLRSMFAPFSASFFIASGWFQHTAAWNGVQPSLSAMSSSTPS